MVGEGARMNATDGEEEEGEGQDRIKRDSLFLPCLLLANFPSFLFGWGADEMRTREEEAAALQLRAAHSFTRRWRSRDTRGRLDTLARLVCMPLSVCLSVTRP